MGAQMRERDVEAHLRRRVEAAGGICEKFLPDLDSGMPDRLVLLPGGVLVWVELKKPRGGVISPIQHYQHARLRKLGQEVRVVWTKEDADQLVLEFTAPHTPPHTPRT